MVLGRRLAVGACVAAPFVGAAALARGVRGALVGARGFADSRVDGAAFPRRVFDAAGVPHTLAAAPRRIASTFLAADEILAELVPLDRVAGVSHFADDTSSSNCHGVYPRAVPRLRAEAERVLAVDPDLVCVAGFTDNEALRLLVGAGPPVVRWSRFDSFGDVLACVRLLGAAVGAEGPAEGLVAGVRAELDQVERRVRGVRRLRVLYYDTPGYTMGAGTLIDEIIGRAGGVNVAAELGVRGPGQIGSEAVLALQPDAIVMPIYGDQEIARERATAAQPLWRRLAGATRAAVHPVPGAWITAVSHHAARGLGRVARLLHPEAFR